MINNTTIAIIGAGPAGLSAALELKKLGFNDLIVFEREEEAGGAPRHCGHLGFGIFEFKRLLSGPNYAKKLASLAKEKNINIKLKSTLIKVDNDILTFSTPQGLEQYKPTCTLFALGARETPRSDLLVSGGRSPNIITTGTLQRFAYIQKIKPFKSAVVVGTELVGFSALMSARHLGVKVEAMIEEQEKIQSFCPLKYITKFLLGTPVYTGVKLENINTQNKNVTSVTISKDGKNKEIPCDGVVFCGKFTPESSILQKSFIDFNTQNSSLNITQNFQSSNKGVFVAGNATRGALAAFRCYFEGKKVASKIKDYLNSKNEPQIVKIEVDDGVAWYYPTMLDIKSPLEGHLTTLRLKQRGRGVIKIYLNDRLVGRKKVWAFPFMSISIPWRDIELKEKDTIRLEFLANS